MKYYIKFFKDYALFLALYKYKQGFDLVFLFITISVDYNKENGINSAVQEQTTAIKG